MIRLTFTSDSKPASRAIVWYGGVLFAAFFLLRILLILSPGVWQHLLAERMLLPVLFLGAVHDLTVVAGMVCLVQIVQLVGWFRARSLMVALTALALGSNAFLFAVVYVDVVYFSFAQAHLPMFFFSYIEYAGFLRASAGALLTPAVLVVGGVVALAIIGVSLRLLGDVIWDKVIAKVRWWILLALVCLGGVVASRVTIANYFSQDLASNFITYRTLIQPGNECKHPGLSQALATTNLEDLAVRLAPRVPLGFERVATTYPAATAPAQWLCERGLLEAARCELDDDGDGVKQVKDCDDQNRAIFPGALEVVGDGVDQDCSGADDPRRNVVVIVLESFGRAFIDPTTTPFLWQLEQTQTAVTDFYSNGTDTGHSLTSILCSVLPRNGEAALPTSQQVNLYCLPRLLRDHGYYTVEYQAGDLNFLHKPAFFDLAGFDAAYGKNELAVEHTAAWGITDEALFNDLTPRLAQLPQPFFGTIYTLAVHHPYEMPSGAATLYPHTSFVNKIKNLMHYSDHALQTFFEVNKNEPWFQNTIFVITSDNGQPTGRRIYNQANFGYLFEENIAIPLVIVNSPQALTRQVVASQVDIAPTIVDLLGIQTINHFQGTSIFSPDHPNRAYATTPYSCMVGLREGAYKVVERFGYRDSAALFDVVSDPNESVDVAKQQTVRFENMIAQLNNQFLLQEHLFNVNGFVNPAWLPDGNK